MPIQGSPNGPLAPVHALHSPARLVDARRFLALPENRQGIWGTPDMGLRVLGRVDHGGP